MNKLGNAVEHLERSLLFALFEAMPDQMAKWRQFLRTSLFRMWPDGRFIVLLAPLAEGTRKHSLHTGLAHTHWIAVVVLTSISSEGVSDEEP
ncbi:unnamed protein product [Protopolystoma xenopodis]|uniref:Uncharacterized protein n=1 Tax=Protopolystoma xenopodis TaxID=117903 RepID=A0A3S5AIT5_9PLAT|nr:unnamed protein product [Protopolystoma xenopodis]